MATYEIFAQPELRRYRSNVFTKATLLMLVIFVLTFIPPLFVVYRSYGFWLKEAYYREWPDVTFKREMIVILELQDPGEYVTYSTYQKYNKLQEDRLRVPVIKAREVDINGDGRYDKLLLDIEMPLQDSENVIGVKLLTVYYYRLKKFSSFFMESLGYIEHFSPQAGAKLEIFGDIQLRQKEPLGHKGVDKRYNETLINTTSSFVETYELSTIFSRYLERNVTTQIGDQYKVWMSGRAQGKPFVITATVNYSEQVILYTPGFWYLIKWGWVQYVSVLVLFVFAFERIKVFIFQNQLVLTTVVSPYDQKKLG
ncbi:transmembrane protein 231-like [Gigantopelta aegis]|uniref:transmembrane protein 231-like n=1 Tax=Gigantopelta aegis TaxID=1735272 RepID=UPI001B88B016|nr:transmembrane protein 231-like [Gigantopelta aegis]